MGQVWGIGKRRFGRDWGRRIWLFDRLVWVLKRKFGNGEKGRGWID